MAAAGDSAAPTAGGFRLVNLLFYCSFTAEPHFHEPENCTNKKYLKE